MKYLIDKFKSIALIIVAILFSTTASSQNIDTNEIIQSSGFTIITLTRGIIGMAFLIFISFLLSNNRKAINWKTASFGLLIQLILAISVLKIPFVKSIFEFAGKIFVKILEFTMEGTKFLFGDLVSMDNFGDVFIFAILPTVIFFAALTSVLFYFGIIQKVVKLMALLLSKVLGVSGPDTPKIFDNIKAISLTTF